MRKIILTSTFSAIVLFVGLIIFFSTIGIKTNKFNNLINQKVNEINSNINDLRTFAKLPPLVKGYLRIGGKFSHDCFVDYKFNTIDLCVIVTTDNLDKKYKKKYLN